MPGVLQQFRPTLEPWNPSSGTSLPVRWWTARQWSMPPQLALEHTGKVWTVRGAGGEERPHPTPAAKKPGRWSLRLKDPYIPVGSHSLHPRLGSSLNIPSGFPGGIGRIRMSVFPQVACLGTELLWVSLVATWRAPSSGNRRGQGGAGASVELRAASGSSLVPGPSTRWAEAVASPADPGSCSRPLGASVSTPLGQRLPACSAGDTDHGRKCVIPTPLCDIFCFHQEASPSPLSAAPEPSTPPPSHQAGCGLGIFGQSLQPDFIMFHFRCLSFHGSHLFIMARKNDFPLLTLCQEIYYIF